MPTHDLIAYGSSISPHIYGNPFTNSNKTTLLSFIHSISAFTQTKKKIALDHKRVISKIQKIEEKTKRKELCEKRVCVYPKKARQNSCWQRTCWLRSHSYWVGPGGVHPCWNKLLQVSPQ